MRSVLDSAVGLLLLAACTTNPFHEVSLDDLPDVFAPDASVAAQGPVLRLSVASMQSPRGSHLDYSRLFELTGQRLGRQTRFVQRRTYREVNELLENGGLDAALLCTGGYLELFRHDPRAVEILAVPVIRGRASFESVIVVPSASPAQSLSDLEGKRFAYADELSMTGHAYVSWAVRQLEKSPDRFFASTIVTNSHDRSIAAVARRVVDGASVHSLVLERALSRDPSLGSKVRVVHRSVPLGPTPVVVSARLDEQARARLREVLLALHQDAEGAAVLRSLEIDRFVAPEAGMFETAAAVVEAPR